MKSNVLIVDDKMVNRKLVRSVLEPNPDLMIHEAADGREALKAILTQDIDLVILDLVMPVADGFSVLREVKQNHNMPLPVIVNSAVDDTETLHRALELGAVDFFTKPLSPAQLKTELPLKVRNALQTYRQSKHIEQLNAKMEEQLRMASVLQRALLHGQCQCCLNNVVKLYQPSGYLAGDFMICEDVEGATWFLSADISGHGVASALLAFMQHAVFTHLIKTCSTPTEVLQQMNKDLCSLYQGEYYFTAFVAKLTGRHMEFSNAGHPYPWIYNPDQGLRSIVQNGFPVGLVENAEYTLGSIELEQGDVLCAWTDGFCTNLIQCGYISSTSELSNKVKDDAAANGLDSEGFRQLVADLTTLPGPDARIDDVAVIMITVD